MFCQYRDQLLALSSNSDVLHSRTSPFQTCFPFFSPYFSLAISVHSAVPLALPWAPFVDPDTVGGAEHMTNLVPLKNASVSVFIT